MISINTLSIKYHSTKKNEDSISLEDNTYFLILFLIPFKHYIDLQRNFGSMKSINDAHVMIYWKK